MMLRMKPESSTVGIVALERREPPAIVEKPDRHDVVDGPLHRIKVTLRLGHGAMGDRVGDEFVEREIEVADGGLRHVVADAERLHLPGKAGDFREFAFQLDDEFVLHRRVAPPRTTTLIKLPARPQ
jgi:hypothetical protein